MVGKPLTSTEATSFSVPSIRATLSLLRSSLNMPASFFHVGARALQCPHHGAPMYARVWVLLSPVISSKFFPTKVRMPSSSYGSAGTSALFSLSSALPATTASANSFSESAEIDLPSGNMYFFPPEARNPASCGVLEDLSNPKNSWTGAAASSSYLARTVTTFPALAEAAPMTALTTSESLPMSVAPMMIWWSMPDPKMRWLDSWLKVR
mmetsp:Transcript_10473/g.28709  ORF Transcript_10473/g.28709 Transcript_10473/m.28709 type:complete len:209 (+) Transcript_10473:1761-2387(+)